MNETMTLLLSIKVPKGEYCFCFDGTAVCRQFDNEGGDSRCLLFDEMLSEDENGAYKLLSCRSLPVKRE